jgi:hypothetical protein
MTLGREMENAIRLNFRKQRRHRAGIANITLMERQARMGEEIGERVQIARVGQLVEDANAPIGLGYDPAHHRRANETRAPRHEIAKLHRGTPFGRRSRPVL